MNPILEEADKIINGERKEQYGEAEDAFGLISQYWSAYITRLLRKAGNENNLYVNDPDGGWILKDPLLTEHDVAMMMILLKIARTDGTKKKDNYVDICGYAALAAQLGD